MRPEVRIVDASGAGQFLEIQPAIDAAFDGDFILVRAGNYSPFILDGRSLTVTADQGALVHVSGGCSVRNLPSSARVLLAGLDLSAATSAPGGFVDGLVATNCQGGLRVERCTLHGYDNPTSDGQAGLVADSCADLVVSDCSIAGGTPQSTLTYGNEGGSGMVAVNCTIAMYRTTFVGADAATGWLQGGTGGDGAVLDGGQVFASDCSFLAGAGGSSPDCDFGYGGDAGYPLREPHGAVLQSIACLEEGALGGTTPCGDSGQSTYPLGSPGPFGSIPGSARSLTANLDPIREGQTLALTVTGVPGETVFLVISLQGEHHFDAALHGVVLTAQPYVLHPTVGTIPASGSLTYTLSLGTGLVPAESALRWYVQGVTLNGAGDVYLTNPVDLVVLDGSF